VGAVVQLSHVELRRRVVAHCESVRRGGAVAGFAPSTKRQVRPSELDAAELCRLYTTGDTAVELGARYGIHRSTAFALLERSGIPPRAHVRKLTDADVQRAALRYVNDRLSLVKIGKELDVDSETIRKELAKAGVEIRSHGRQRASR